MVYQKRVEGLLYKGYTPRSAGRWSRSSIAILSKQSVCLFWYCSVKSLGGMGTRINMLGKNRFPLSATSRTSTPPNGTGTLKNMLTRQSCIQSDFDFGGSPPRPFRWDHRNQSVVGQCMPFSERWRALRQHQSVALKGAMFASSRSKTANYTLQVTWQNQ